MGQLIDEVLVASQLTPTRLQPLVELVLDLLLRVDCVITTVLSVLLVDCACRPLHTNGVLQTVSLLFKLG